MERVETIFGQEIECKKVVKELANVAIVEDYKNERHVVHLLDLHKREKRERTTREKQRSSIGFDLEETKKRGRSGRAVKARKM